MVRKEKSAGIIIYYFDKEPKFLLLKYSTYWGYAKGLIEENESEEQAAMREVREETTLENIKLIPGFKYEQSWTYTLNNEIVRKKAIFFLARVTKQESEKVKISSEHEDFAWLSYEEAIKKMKIKNNKEMLTSARDFILEHENQKRLV